MRRRGNLYHMSPQCHILAKSQKNRNIGFLKVGSGEKRRRVKEYQLFKLWVCNQLLLVGNLSLNLPTSSIKNYCREHKTDFNTLLYEDTNMKLQNIGAVLSSMNLTPTMLCVFSLKISFPET